MTSTLARQIIRNGKVLNPERQTADTADLLIEGDMILEIGPPGLDAPEDAAAIDATDRLLIPGLINAHTHGHGSLSKGYGDKWSLELLLNAAPWIGGGLTLEGQYLAARLNAAEMVLKGCTAAYDMFFQFPEPNLESISAVAQGYTEIGIRAVIAPMMADTTFYQAIPGLLDSLPEPHRNHAAALEAAPWEDHIAGCRALLQNWPTNRERVRPALGPTIPMHCTDDFIRACRDLAQDYDIGLQMHLGESKLQAVAGLKRYGKSLTAHLDSLGLIGPNFTGAHCIWLDDDDVGLLADRGAKVAHNPGSNLRLGNGVAPARRMLDAGVTLGIGTDGSSSGDHQNMVEAMRMAAFASRLMVLDPDGWLGSWDVLRAGTLGGAALLGMSGQIGHIAPGYKADIVFVDLTNVAFVPLNDAANQIVNCADGSAIDSVMIGGRMVLANRRFTALDFDGLRRDAQTMAETLREQNAQTHSHMEAMAEYVSHHCIGLACEGYHAHRRIDEGLA